MFKNLEQLTKKIKKQKNKNPNISYTASLFKKGKNFCIKKFMEESRELAASAKYSNKKNIIIVKFEGYYEPLYTYLYTSKREIRNTVLFSSVNSSTIDTSLKGALVKIQTFFQSTCKPAQLIKSIVQNKSFDAIVEILKSKETSQTQIHNVKQIVEFSGKVIGMQITYSVTRKEQTNFTFKKFCFI